MRKTTHYILILLAALTAKTTVMRAQSSRAIGEAFLQTLLEARNIQQNADSLESHLIEKYRKDPAVLTEIGRAYYRSGNTDKAGELYDKALSINPKFARALVGHGEIFRYRVAKFRQDNPEAFHDSAYHYYMKAIEAEPANQVAYDSMMVLLADNCERYYKKHTHEDSLKAAETYETSIALLNQLKQNDPTAFVEADKAHIYMQMGKPSMALEQYQSVLDKLNETQYFNYCMCLYSLDKYDETIEAANAGFGRYPEYKDFCRPIFYAQSDKKQYRDAVATYNDVLKLNTIFARDHTHALICYLNLNDTREATMAANRIYDTDDENTFKAVEMAAKTIMGKAEGHEKRAEFNEAIDVYRTYYEEKDYSKAVNFYATKTQNPKTEEELRAADMFNWVTVYFSKATEEFDETGQQKGLEQMTAEAKECEDALRGFQTKYPDYKKENILYCLAVAWRGVDIKENYANGRALPYFQQLVALASDEGLSNSHTVLTYAYHYMSLYNYFVVKDLNKGIAYAKKFKELNPESTDLDGIINTKVNTSRRRR